MTPEERKSEGAAINALKDRVNAALPRAARSSRRRRSQRGSKTETRRRHVAGARAALETAASIRSRQVMDELAAIFADMGFSIAEGPDIETDDYNFTKLNFPPDHPAREMHDTFFLNRKPDGERQGAAHPYEPGAGAHHAVAKAADPRDLSRPHLSLRFGPDAYADVPSGRGPGHRPLGAILAI